MAKQIGVDVNFIMALSALESHWDDTHARDLGNLFGLKLTQDATILISARIKR